MPIALLKNKQFYEFQSALELKRVSGKGIGATRQQAAVITEQ